MPIKVAKTDVNKAGWQRLRHNCPEMEASGVGKALEAYKADYLKGSDALFKAGSAVWNQALKRGVEVSKALAAAKAKANAIKDATRKKEALEVVGGYEAVINKFSDEILTLEDNRKKRIAAVTKARGEFRDGLTFDKLIADSAVLKAFLAFAAGEHSLMEAEAAVGWQQKKYKEVTLKYGPSNDWNQESTVTQRLVDHFSDKKKLSDPDLKNAIGAIEAGFAQMVRSASAQSSFGRFQRSKAMDAFLESKFPG